MGVLTRVVAAIAIAAVAVAAQAQTFIRDAEIERTLARMTGPVYEAAGIDPDSVRMFVMLDSRLNAFVTGRNIVLNTGLLQRFDRPEAVIGVIAHEVGHITGGHLARREIALRGAGPMQLGVLLAAAAAAAAGAPDVGMAAALGGTSAMQRAFLAFSRAEEAAADQAGVTYMTRAGFDPDGMLDVLRLFRGQEVFASSRIDPYAQTHPLSAERIALLERAVAESPARGRPAEPELVYWFERMRAKLDGFINRPEQTLARLRGAADADSEFNLYRRAIAEHRMADVAGALATLDRLQRMRPNDPYYYALRGQVLFENARPAEAVAPFRRALALAPDEPLIAGQLGRALVASGDPALEREALGVLERAARDDPGEPGVLRDLAAAHARAGDTGMAALVTAERMALSGDFEGAARQARSALGHLPAGSPAARRAEDIVDLAPTR
ncbi:MAG: tetratricopeptide repeat protein [Rhodobacteraceae bacterium]|nr:MAG: tetratricopeptide repeat protein [Paracoccaceae bacterium]